MPTLAIWLLGLMHGAAAFAACADWNPIDHQIASRARDITAEDMIGLANFGRPDGEPMGSSNPIALSPDGQLAAFILQRADLAANGYCQALVVIDLAGRTAPRILDRGGDYIIVGFVFRKMYLLNGSPRVNAPAWSDDGQSIAYLRRDRGSTQLWRAQLDGTAPTQITRAPVDVDAWSWGADGRSLIYATIPARLDAERRIDEEGLAGWHYDARFAPMYGTRPQAPAPQSSSTTRVDPDTGRALPVSAADRKALTLDREESFTEPRSNDAGDKAWLERASPSPYSPLRLVAAAGSGTRYDCGEPCARGLVALWWHADRSLTFIRREGWNRRYNAIYRWTPGRGRPRRLLHTDDIIDGCRPTEIALICTREGASRPARLIAIDRRTGAQRVLFDPNLGFGLLTLGRVSRLEWRNVFGREVYGDLLLPPAYRGGALPTIVVQYRSEGFLRGGTGNEYPIYLFAQRGFAVLSIQSPAQIAATDPDVRTEDDLGRANTVGWAERRNTLSAVEEGVRLLMARGITDPSRVGITGVSDGATTVRFALSNTKMFAAAAVSSCCVDESSDVLVGPAWAAFTRRIGYPPAYPVDPAFWQPNSLVLNASRITTPLLMQLADSEMLIGLPSFTALAAYRQPVDLYVFPDEFHVKWQPRHRRALFERNLDWFSFWLQGREDSTLAKTNQFERWRKLRAARPENSPIAPPPPAPSP